MGSGMIGFIQRFGIAPVLSVNSFQIYVRRQLLSQLDTICRVRRVSVLRGCNRTSDLVNLHSFDKAGGQYALMALMARAEAKSEVKGAQTRPTYAEG